MTSRIQRFLLNYLSTLAVAWLAIHFYTEWSPYHLGLLNNWMIWSCCGFEVSTSFRKLMWNAFWVYVVALVPYYFFHPRMRSKAGILLTHFFKPMQGRRSNPWVVRQAALSIAVKFFFAPLMINWLLGHFIDLNRTFASLLQYWDFYSGRMLFDGYLFWTILQIIVLVDVFVFTLGYLIEIPALGNRIRSVEPTLFGWAVCLICYPPFNGWMGQIIPWRSSDLPYFSSDGLHYAMSILALVLMAVYAWASFALGLKASNLTNRGIVTTGPYRFVRHPAYFCKNMVWWIGALPFLVASYRHASISQALTVIFGMGAWSTIYYLRAVTEERHLLLGHNGYREYVKRVPYRFIPGVI